MGLPVTGVVDKETYAEILQWVGPVPDAADNHVGDKSSPTGTFWDGALAEIKSYVDKAILGGAW